MGRKINIIIDASGSMKEDNKNYVIKYLLNGICSAMRIKLIENTEFNLFQWGKETKQFENIENAKVKFYGKAKIKGLEKIKKLINESDTILFVSDGNLDLEEEKEIKKLSKKIIPIYIGIDVNRNILKKISTDKEIYSVVDFIQAIKDA